MKLGIRKGLYRPVLSGGFEWMRDENVVALIEQHLHEGKKLAVYQKTTGANLGEEAYDMDRRKNLPLVGYQGQPSMPFISDPFGKIRGAIGIKERKLIYSASGILLHEMRDAYRWGYALDRVYVRSTFRGIIREFLDAGYTLCLSDNMRGPDDQRVNIVGETTLDEILGRGK